MQYSEVILKFMEEKNVSAYALAKATGIKEATFSKWRKVPTSNISILYIEKIAKYFNITVNELLGNETENALALSQSERGLVNSYRSLDKYGRRAVSSILEIESDRTAEQVKTPETQTRPINIYRLPVSAGTGIELLDEEEPETIFIPLTPESQRADFVLRVSGNSMEPDFSDGDLILIRQAQAIDPGELGVFGVDGQAYFKRLGDNCLISLNADYPPVPIHEYSDMNCFGRVLGKIEKVDRN